MKVIKICVWRIHGRRNAPVLRGLGGGIHQAKTCQEKDREVQGVERVKGLTHQGAVQCGPFPGNQDFGDMQVPVPLELPAFSLVPFNPTLVPQLGF